MFSLFRLFLVVFVVFAFSEPVCSAAPKQIITPATKSDSPLKVYFDVNLGVPHKLETRLMLINTTYDQLVAQGYHPEFIVGFRGKASFYVTKGDGYVEPEYLAIKKKIHQWVATLKQRGIRIEQCLIAAGLTGIDPQHFLTNIEVVDNGYVSMIIYQNRGFSQIPMD